MGQENHLDYLQLIQKIISKNKEFLNENAKEVLDELVSFLIHDVIENVKFAVNIKNNYANWAMHNFIIFVFQPFSYAIYIDLLSGNLPVCFFEIRFLLEALAKHYLADAKYPSHLFFEQKLELLEIELSKNSVTFSDLMKELDKILTLENSCSLLWKETSSKWIHASGLLKRVNNRIITGQALPPWGIIIPAPYNKDDLPDIKELKKQLLVFKKISNEAIKSWKSFL